MVLQRLNSLGTSSVVHQRQYASRHRRGQPRIKGQIRLGASTNQGIYQRCDSLAVSLMLTSLRGHRPEVHDAVDVAERPVGHYEYASSACVSLNFNFRRIKNQAEACAQRRWTTEKDSRSEACFGREGSAERRRSCV